MQKKTKRATGGIQSLDVSLSVLLSLAEYGRPVALTELSDSTGMAPSKIHRYITSFVAAGLMSQRADSRRYELGPMAMRLGVAALGQSNFVQRATEQLVELVDQTGLAAHLSVWGTYGPVIIHWEYTNDFPPPIWKLGATLPLLDSSAGKVFSTFLPSNEVNPIIRKQAKISVSVRDKWDTTKARREGIIGIQKEIRKNGLAKTNWPFTPAQCSIAAPIFNWQGQLELVVTLIADRPDASILRSGDPAQDALLKFVKRISVLPE